MAPRKKKSDDEMAPYAEPSFIEEDVLMDPVEEEDRFGDSLGGDRRDSRVRG